MLCKPPQPKKILSTIEAVRKREIAEAVCNRSILDLLKSSGYIQDHDAVTEQQLQIVFEANPELIRPWVILSDDRRTKYGYYLLPPGASPNSRISRQSTNHLNISGSAKCRHQILCA